MGVPKVSFKQKSIDSSSRRGYTTATTGRSSKTQVTRRATFFKEIPQIIPQGELSSAHQLVKKIALQFKDFNSTPDRKVSVAGQLGKTDKR